MRSMGGSLRTDDYPIDQVLNIRAILANYRDRHNAVADKFLYQ
jgi:hypothetical protein